MGESQLYRKSDNVAIIMTVLALIFGGFALIASFFVGKSFVYIAIGLLLSLPSVVLSVYVLSKERICAGIPIVSLIVNKLAWIVMACFIVLKIYQYIIQYFI